MLMFVSILGIMISISIPLFASTNGARQATHKQNAQTICSLATAAAAAGLNVASGTTDAEKAMLRLVKGVTITKGSLKGRAFSIPNMTAEDVKSASKYATIKNGELVFASDPIKTELL